MNEFIWQLQGAGERQQTFVQISSTSESSSENLREWGRKIAGFVSHLDWACFNRTVTPPVVTAGEAGVTTALFVLESGWKNH